MGPRCQISAGYPQQHTWAKKKGKIRVYWANLIGLGLFLFDKKERKKVTKNSQNPLC